MMNLKSRKTRVPGVIVFLTACTLVWLPAIFFAHGQAGTAIVRPSPPYWEVLAKSTITAAGNQIPAAGTLKFQARKRLRITLYISGYGGGGETAAYQFNGDTAAANYRQFCTTTADGITWAAGTNNAVSTDRIRVAPSNSNRSRNVESIITNDPGQVEKTVGFLTVTGTGSAATQTSQDLCNGAWVSAANIQITQLAIVTTTANMGARSSVVVEGSNF